MFPFQVITTSIILLSIINTSISMDTAIQMTRNQYYRACVWKKTKVAIIAKKSAKLRKRIADLKYKIKSGSEELYNYAMFNCCDLQVTYYGLSPETREIIEQIIGLNF
jgi:hypothetical protein